MDPEFREAALRRGVKEKTLVILEENDIDNLDILRTQTTDSLTRLGVTAGQAGVLKLLMGDAQPETQDQAESKLVVESVHEAAKVSTSHLKDDRLTVEDHMAVHRVRETKDDKSRISPGAQGTRASSKALQIKQAKTESKVNTTMLNKSPSAHSWINRIKAAIGIKVQAPLPGSKAEDKFTQELNEKGLKDIDKLLEDQLDLNLKQKVHVGITGQSGQGKSSLINSLMNLECDDPNAAETDVIECTIKMSQFKHPSMENIIFHDLPGCNTQKFPQSTYIDDVKLKKYDAVIICTSVRFTATDSWLAAFCRDNNIPFYFVRTKLDIDIGSNEAKRSKKLSEQDLLNKMRANIADSIQGSFPPDSVYLVCTHISHQTQWDMPRLQEEIISKIGKKNQAVLILALTATSEKVINLKYDELKERIPLVAQRAVLATNPTEIVQNEVEIYRKKFGLSENNFQKWGINPNKMSRRAQKLNKTLTELDIGLKMEKTNLDSVENLEVEEETSRRSVGKWFLGVGYFVGWAMDNSATEAKLKQKQELVDESESRVEEFEEKVEEAAINFLEETLEMYKDMTTEVLDARKKVYLNQ